MCCRYVLIWHVPHYIADDQDVKGLVPTFLFRKEIKKNKLKSEILRSSTTNGDNDERDLLAIVRLAALLRPRAHLLGIRKSLYLVKHEKSTEESEEKILWRHEKIMMKATT